MESIPEQVKHEFAMLTGQDGVTVRELADATGYSADMIYKIQNPGETAAPSLERFLMGSRRLSEEGNNRLARLAHSVRYVLRSIGEHLINLSFDDERRDIIHAIVSMENACDVSDWRRAEQAIDVLDTCVQRCRLEVAAMKGAKVHATCQSAGRGSGRAGVAKEKTSEEVPAGPALNQVT